jgi:hypothetical protein
MISYQATFMRMYRHEELGAEERKRRPATTDDPNESPFVVYWEFDSLTEVDPYPITDLRAEDGSSLSPVFVPHGPLAVAG